MKKAKTFTAIARGPVYKHDSDYEMRVSNKAIKAGGGHVILKNVPNTKFWRQEAERVNGRYRVYEEKAAPVKAEGVENAAPKTAAAPSDAEKGMAAPKPGAKATVSPKKTTSRRNATVKAKGKS